MGDHIDASDLYDRAITLIDADGGESAITHNALTGREITLIKGEDGASIRLLVDSDTPIIFSRDVAPTQGGAPYGLGYVRDYIEDAIRAASSTEENQ